MKATVEFAKGLAGFVRAGPVHNQFGDLYDFFVGFDCPGFPSDRTAIIKGLITDKGSPLKTDIELTRAHVRAATDALAAVGLKAHWERARHMKNPTPHASTVTDPAEHKKHIETAFALALEGKLVLKLDSIEGVTELTPEGADVRTYKLHGAVITASPKV